MKALKHPPVPESDTSAFGKIKKLLEEDDAPALRPNREKQPPKQKKKGKPSTGLVGEAAEPSSWFSWSQWSPWTSCSRKACGVRGIQTRRRTCLSSASEPERRPRPKCPGKSTARRICTASPCPACALRCDLGAPNGDCSRCVCPNDTLVGVVRSAGGAALPNARVSLSDQPRAILARSDSRGRFAIQGVCADSPLNASATLDRFAPGHAPIAMNSSNVSWVEIVLHRLEKAYMVIHPESKVRMAGQKVRFCCHARGNPKPKKYYWYHNGTLLDRKVYKYNSSLVLHNLGRSHAGSYHCKASNDHSSIKSSVAYLTVVGKRRGSAEGEISRPSAPRSQRRMCKPA
ncbi:hypothetical protein JRQ81_008780 [Phrynocephalus forsythii]|uniref:Ig-like domain-containing protein n=1 Tax=Phrynocephalus forsythii TaxID=171643 RepID=A0A9Q1ASZ9_9SAUR|nr:hypothetical protein JRQ81_008780 [Phrynocephalus forsythii]